MLINRIKGKTVLITGASSGIGYASAIALAKLGANLILFARRVDRLDELKEKLENDFNIKVHTSALDITHGKQVELVFNHLTDDMQKIDILINNAGLAQGLDSLQNMAVDDIDRMIDTNIKGFIRILKASLPRMISGGHIINIGSISSNVAYANGAVYCATKHAVHAISRSIREELLESGIKVSEIMPGLVNTEFSTVRFHNDKDKADKVYDGMQPLIAEDIADLIAYCANLPSHVNLAETLILPTSQSDNGKVYRTITI